MSKEEEMKQDEINDCITDILHDLEDDILDKYHNINYWDKSIIEDFRVNNDISKEDWEKIMKRLDSGMV